MKTGVRRVLIHAAHGSISLLLFVALSVFLLVYQGPYAHLVEAGGNVPSPSPTSSPTADATTAPSTSTPAPTTLTPAPTAGPTAFPTIEGLTLLDLGEPGLLGWILLVDDPTRLFVATAPRMLKVGATVRDMVVANDAIGGINGGGFLDPNGQGNGSTPLGIVINDGKVLYQQSGVTQFKILGFTQQDRLVTSDGMSLAEIKKADFRWAITFGPTLVRNGKLVNLSSINVGTSRRPNPRCALGQRADGTVVLCCIDGRNTLGRGATLELLQQVMQKQGCVLAVNLDGGSSATLVLFDKTVNNPCNVAGERTMPTSILISR